MQIFTRKCIFFYFRLVCNVYNTRTLLLSHLMSYYAHIFYIQFVFRILIANFGTILSSPFFYEFFQNKQQHICLYLFLFCALFLLIKLKFKVLHVPLTLISQTLQQKKKRRENHFFFHSVVVFRQFWFYFMCQEKIFNGSDVDFWPKYISSYIYKYDLYSCFSFIIIYLRYAYD